MEGTTALTLTNIITNAGEVLTGLLGMGTDLVNWIFATPGVAFYVYAAMVLIVLALVGGFIKR